MLKIIALSMLASSSALAEDHCLSGCPVGAAQSNIEITRPIYKMSFDIQTKFADWVAYKVTRSTIGKTQKRNWKTDPEIPNEFELEPDDYKGAYATLKTDRGHQVPLASFTSTPYWKMTNYLSNITPQKSNLNQGSWVRLENAVRELVRNTGDVFVITGPIYETDQEQMVLPGADEPHQVPTGYFKIVAKRDGRVSTFLFDQDVPRNYPRCDALVTLEETEIRSGLNIFPENSNFKIGTLDDLPPLGSPTFKLDFDSICRPAVTAGA